jgi:hypothetical protein
VRAVVAIAVCATSARADVIDRPIVLDEHQVELDATLELELATSSFARPLSIAPDLWWGVTSHLTVGLIHSHASLDQIDAGASFCLRTAELGCERTYRGSGVDARYLVYRDDAIEIAPRVRALVRDLDPIKPAVTLGALMRWRDGRFAIATDPYLQLGLENRAAGNRSQLWLPVYLELAPACAWVLAVHTGWNAELVTIGDDWHVPLALSARVAVAAGFELAVEAGFPTLGGPQNNVKQSAAMLTVAWHD